MYLPPPTLIETRKLKTHPNNPRYIRKDKLENLKKSITEDPDFMEHRALLVNPQMEVFAGNQRLRACQALGWEKVPCYVLDWDEEKQRRAMIKDNGHHGEWDTDMLANDGWDEEQLQEWGVPIDWEPVQETEGLTDPDVVPEVPEEPTTKPGDLWLLGEHRLLCGDSTKAEDVERLMDGEKADALVTDPPYGIGVDKSMHEKGGQQYGKAAAPKREYAATDWDRLPPQSLIDEISSFQQSIIFGGNYFNLPPARCWLVWDKENGSNQFADCELAWTNLDAPVRIKRHMWNGMIRKDREERLSHPTQKPVEVMRWCIEKTTGSVYDPFLGSGTTLIAAEQLGRKCYGMELDPKYCDVIVKRWEDFTGKKAELWKQ